jgi:hypothetical protein
MGHSYMQFESCGLKCHKSNVKLTCSLHSIRALGWSGMLTVEPPYNTTDVGGGGKLKPGSEWVGSTTAHILVIVTLCCEMEL